MVYYSVPSTVKLFHSIRRIQTELVRHLNLPFFLLLVKVTQFVRTPVSPNKRNSVNNDFEVPDAMYTNGEMENHVNVQTDQVNSYTAFRPFDLLSCVQSFPKNLVSPNSPTIRTCFKISVASCNIISALALFF